MYETALSKLDLFCYCYSLFLTFTFPSTTSTLVNLPSSLQGSILCLFRDTVCPEQKANLGTHCALKLTICSLVRDIC